MVTEMRWERKTRTRSSPLEDLLRRKSMIILFMKTALVIITAVVITITIIIIIITTMFSRLFERPVRGSGYFLMTCAHNL